MNTKRCWGCEQDLPTDAFHKDKGKRDGLQSKCKVCQYGRYLERLAENPEKVRAIARESARRNRKRQLYNLTNEDFDAMVTAQDGKCKLCRKQPPPKEGTKGGLVVDHDHATGKVRGLLCHNCNRGLGLLGDDPATVTAAIVYLVEHADPGANDVIFASAGDDYFAYGRLTYDQARELHTNLGELLREVA